MLLGSLVRSMGTQGILCPRPVPPFLGYGVMETIRFARQVEAPKWASVGLYSRRYGHSTAHSCSLGEFLKADLDQIEARVGDLVLEETFPSLCPVSQSKIGTLETGELD